MFAPEALVTLKNGILAQSVRDLPKPKESVPRTLKLLAKIAKHLSFNHGFESSALTNKPQAASEA
jgi:hypothetical protein